MSGDRMNKRNQDIYVKWDEGASILDLKRNTFFYLVQSEQVRAEPNRKPRDGRYNLQDIMRVKEKREQGKPRKQYKRRLAPVIFDWLSHSDIPAILRLDQVVYDQMFLAEAAVYEQWSSKNPYLAMAAFDAKSDRQEMLAYVAALPLDESLILSIMRGEREEISITPDEIETYERPGGYTLLGNSAVNHPERPDLLYKILYRMTAFWIERYPEQYITRIYAQSVSERGDRMIQHFFMAPRYDLAPNAYMLDLARPGASKVIHWFQSQLLQKAPLPTELQRPYIPTYVGKKPQEPLQPQKQLVEKSTLPEGLVGWRAFARLHGITESTVQKSIVSGRLPIIENGWIVGRAKVRGALDENGKARFYELYHENKNFISCSQCPHLQT